MITILEDTRQQESKHKVKHQWFIRNGIHWNRSCLTCGDYQLPGKGDVAVDTKFSIQELIGDVQAKKKAKSKILEEINNLGLEKFEHKEMLYHLICDDDSERFPEREITDYCFKNGINEGIQSKLQQLYVQRQGFFHRGLLRAKNYGVDLYILVDNKDGIASVDDLFRWVNPRSKIFVNTNQQIGFYKNGRPKYKKTPKYPNCMKGQHLAKACKTMELKYGCHFLFCKPEESGQKIVEILTKKND